jgi:hypothetical protein
VTEWNGEGVLPLLEDVFRRQGTPTYTYVEPARYNEIRLAVREKGRCVVIEGPSGIGKSTIIDKILSDLGMKNSALTLSARNKEDLDLINQVLFEGKLGFVIIDDFHRLDDDTKKRLADKMKTIADGGNIEDKLIVIGINKAGDRLIDFASDLAMRIDIFRLEANPPEKIVELVELGEKSLNIIIRAKSELVARSQGSFQIAQVLCYALCAREGVEDTQTAWRELNVSLAVVVERVMEDLDRQFGDACLTFARGSQLRREGRAPYLHILKWIADKSDWSLDLAEELRQHPEHRGSIGQVIDKGFLAGLLTDTKKSPILVPHFHYDPESTVLSVEDPKLVFYLKNLVWRAFSKKAGFTSEYFDRPYDFALSFAGAQRSIAEKLRDLLVQREISVFYDRDEQHKILAVDVEDYLVPIYRTEALFVLPILSPDYPTRIWAKIESDAFRDRFGSGSVIPIKLNTVQEGFFNDYMKYGHLSLDLSKNIDEQLEEIADTLARRMLAERADAANLAISDGRSPESR